ncbi:MAG: hypothetical protein M3065_18770 [Actinomycetota bacterium]|nr:hypothetical protein [Actinomycetota bacterium]
MQREGLLVDYGGVLTTDLFDSFRAFCELEGLDPETIGRRFREDRDCRELLIGLETGKLEEVDFQHELAAVLGVKETQLIDWHFVGSGPDPVMLGAVRAAGVRTGMVSNSGEVGVRKPAPKIYALGAESIGLAPSAGVFVDDLRLNADPGGRARAAARGPAAMTRRAAKLAVIAALVAVALSGCGSGTLTAKALRQQASLVCTTAVRHSARIAMPSSNSGGAAFLAQGIAVFRPELAALKQLEPPRRLAEAYRAALGDAKQQLDALIATDHTLGTGEDPVVAIKQLDVELAAIDVRDREAWRALGAPACANLPSG